MVYSHKWSPISYRSSAGQGSSPAEYRHSTAVPRSQRGVVFLTFRIHGSPYAIRPLSVLSVTVYGGQTVGWIKMKFGMQVGLSPGHTVLDGDPPPLTPNFRPISVVAKWLDGLRRHLTRRLGLGPGHIMLHGDPAPLPQKGAEPPTQFPAHFYCGQTVRCIKMPLGREVGFSPGDVVLDGDPPPTQKGGTVANFRPVSIGQTAAWITMPLGTEVASAQPTLC